MRRIVAAKGIDVRRRASTRADRNTCTVLEGARLLADRVAPRRGHGPLIVIDPGGATTDVRRSARRTLETSVLRHGLPTLRQAHREGRPRCAPQRRRDYRAKWASRRLRPTRRCQWRRPAAIAALHRNVDALPATRRDSRSMQHSVRTAITSRSRSCRRAQTCTPRDSDVQRGKDLRDVTLVVGTGGALVHARDPATILEVTTTNPPAPASLRPHAPASRSTAATSLRRRAASSRPNGIRPQRESRLPPEACHRETERTDRRTRSA